MLCQNTILDVAACGGLCHVHLDPHPLYTVSTFLSISVSAFLPLYLYMTAKLFQRLGVVAGPRIHEGQFSI